MNHAQPEGTITYHYVKKLPIVAFIAFVLALYSLFYRHELLSKTFINVYSANIESILHLLMGLPFAALFWLIISIGTRKTKEAFVSFLASMAILILMNIVRLTFNLNGSLFFLIERIVFLLPYFLFLELTLKGRISQYIVIPFLVGGLSFFSETNFFSHIIYLLLEAVNLDSFVTVNIKDPDGFNYNLNLFDTIQWWASGIISYYIFCRLWHQISSGLFSHKVFTLDLKSNLSRKQYLILVPAFWIVFFGIASSSLAFSSYPLDPNSSRLINFILYLWSFFSAICLASIYSSTLYEVFFSIGKKPEPNLLWHHIPYINILAWLIHGTRMENKISFQRRLNQFKLASERKNIIIKVLFIVFIIVMAAYFGFMASLVKHPFVVMIFPITSLAFVIFYWKNPKAIFTILGVILFIKGTQILFFPNTIHIGYYDQNFLSFVVFYSVFHIYAFQLLNINDNPYNPGNRESFTMESESIIGSTFITLSSEEE